MGSVEVGPGGRPQARHRATCHGRRSSASFTSPEATGSSAGKGNVTGLRDKVVAAPSVLIPEHPQAKMAGASALGGLEQTHPRRISLDGSARTGAERAPDDGGLGLDPRPPLGSANHQRVEVALGKAGTALKYVAADNPGMPELGELVDAVAALISESRTGEEVA